MRVRAKRFAFDIGTERGSVIRLSARLSFRLPVHLAWLVSLGFVQILFDAKKDTLLKQKHNRQSVY